MVGGWLWISWKYTKSEDATIRPPQGKITNTWILRLRV